MVRAVDFDFAVDGAGQRVWRLAVPLLMGVRFVWRGEQLAFDGGLIFEDMSYAAWVNEPSVAADSAWGVFYLVVLRFS